MVIETDEKSPIKNNLKLPSPYFLWRKLTYVSRNGRHYSYTYWVLMEYLRQGSGIHKVKKFLGRIDKLSREEAVELAWDEIGNAKQGISIQEKVIEWEVPWCSHCGKKKVKMITTYTDSTITEKCSKCGHIEVHWKDGAPCPKCLGKLDCPPELDKCICPNCGWEEGIPISEPPIDIEIVEVKPDDAEDLVVEIEGKTLGGYCPHKRGHCYYLEDGEYCGCESTIDHRISIHELERCRFMKKEVAA